MTKMASKTVYKPQTSGNAYSVTLEKVIADCSQSKSSWGLRQNDIAFALAFWSMVDCGFKCVAVEGTKNESVLPKDWKHDTRHLYEAHFVLPPHFDYPVKLVALPAGEILCLNVLASNLSSKNISLKSLAIYSPGYVPRPEEDAVSEKFSGLTDFKFLLKTVMIWPIRCSILTDQGIMNGSLCGVSDELKLKIIRHLSVPDVLMLSRTCRDLHRLCNDQGLWKSFYHDSFKSQCECNRNPNKCDDTKDWKESYKLAFTQKKTEKSFHSSSSGSYVTAREGPYGSEIDLEID